MLNFYIYIYYKYKILILYSVKSAHVTLKQYIGNKAKGDLYTTWQKIKQAATSQVLAIRYTSHSDQIRMPIEFDKKLFQSVFGTVTWFAMRKV